MNDTDAADTVPVTIITGFLGSGKTTLFNHILTAAHGKRIAVIQNEFGEVGIDDALMAKNTKFQSGEEIVEVLNGCICCSVRKDLVDVLKKLAKRRKAGKLSLDAIVIETTGMADPSPVAQTLLVDEDVKAFARLDGIVTLVDAKHIEQHLDEVKPEGTVNESVQQVAFADKLLLNKVDLVPDEKRLQRIEQRLRGINAFAPIQRCTKSQVSVNSVLGINGFDLQRTLEANPSFLDVTKAPTKHDEGITSLSINQGAARHMRTVPRGDLDLALTEDWIGSFLEEHGEDLYRMKGVLAIAHSSQRFVFHAVHMLMDGCFAEPWEEGEPRESKLVFIGKNIDRDKIVEGFKACLATPENLRAKEEALRFKVGDSVECNTFGDEWKGGEVVQLMYRDEGMPPGLVAPYQVELVTGDLIWAPSDSDCVIRAPPRRKSQGRVSHKHGAGPSSSSGPTPYGQGKKRTKHSHAGHKNKH